VIRYLKKSITGVGVLSRKGIRAEIKIHTLILTTDSFLCQVGEVKTEYRAWNPFRSKLAAAILGGVDQIHMGPGKKVLYLGAASGTTVSHVSDIVGPVSS